MTQTSYIDLNGVLNIQKDYLGNLNASDTSDIKNELSKLYNAYSVANVSTDSAITRQREVIDIVNAEKQRLEQKKQSVDNAVFGQKRAVELNNSNRIKQNSYTNLLIILIITLCLIIGIIMASKQFTFIPQIVFDLLTIIVISISIYVSLYSFLNIQSRNNMNFNELDLPGLKNSTAGNSIARGVSGPKNLITGDMGCMGNDCCGPLTEWDQENGVCIPITTQGFTTMTFPYNKGDINHIAANSPYEFDKYVPSK
jgi:hypothetical protein